MKNIGQMMKQAQQMQAKMAELQARLGEMEVDGQSGGGMVQATLSTYSGRTKLESGELTPSNHDGTSTFDGPRGATLLVNNHELAGPRANWPHPVPLTEGLVYDPAEEKTRIPGLQLPPGMKLPF